jgi:hypothetical protein
MVLLVIIRKQQNDNVFDLIHKIMNNFRFYNIFLTRRQGGYNLN